MKNLFALITILSILLIACVAVNKPTRKPISNNYINYYNRVYAIDSLWRDTKDTLSTIKKYEQLFNEYKQPINIDFIHEYETYVLLCDSSGKNFGGKKSLNRLVTVIAPFWKYRKNDKELFALYKKYGIDSIALQEKVKIWENGLNKQLIDSFSIASIRDQELQRSNIYIQKMNDKKNAALLHWTFKKFGFPSPQKIGLFNEKDFFLKVGTIIHHMAGGEEYERIRKKVWKYVKSGECNPMDYATMVDRHQQLNKKESEYGTEYMFGVQPYYPIDSIKINRNRKKIGLPSIKQHLLIMKSE